MRGDGIVVRLGEKKVTEIEFCWFIGHLPYYCRDRIVMELMYNCGLRVCDAVCLHIQNFSGDFSILHYFPKKQKVHSIRKVYVPSWLSKKINKYVSMTDIRVSGGYLFPIYGHGAKCVHMKSINFRQAFYVYRKTFRKFPESKFLDDCYEMVYMPNGSVRKYYRFAPHALRAAYITNTISEVSRLKSEEKINVDDVLLQVSKIIGHADPRTTYRYYRSHITDIIKQEILRYKDREPDGNITILPLSQKRLAEFN